MDDATPFVSTVYNSSVKSIVCSVKLSRWKKPLTLEEA